MKYGIVVVVVAFLAIVGTIVLIGSGDSSSKTPARNTNLVDFENKDSASVSWTQQGQLVGEDRRQAIRITVTRNKRVVEILDGFEQRVSSSSEAVNTPAAFSAFTRALDNASFGQERNVAQPDDRGICPTGNVFVYRLTDLGKEVMRTWSDTCEVSDGPFGGGNRNAPLIARLFKAQITNYSTFTRRVNL